MPISVDQSKYLNLARQSGHSYGEKVNIGEVGCFVRSHSVCDDEGGGNEGLSAYVMVWGLCMHLCVHVRRTRGEEKGKGRRGGREGQTVSGGESACVKETNLLTQSNSYSWQVSKHSR